MFQNYNKNKNVSCAISNRMQKLMKTYSFGKLRALKLRIFLRKGYIKMHNSYLLLTFTIETAIMKLLI
jgi:hypothetical protein